MRKIGIFLALLAFLLFLFLGLQAARLFVAPGDGPSGNLPSPATSLQSNILLVHVNRLDGDNPELISLWVIFSYQAEPPSLTFLPVYPTGKDRDGELAASFSITSDGKVSTTFLQRLEREFQVDWDHLVVIDDAGLDFWSQHLTGGDYTQSTNDGGLLHAEINLYSKFCAEVRNNGSQLLSSADWSQIVPRHLSTDLPLNAGFAELDRIQRSGLCDVFEP
jgi:hypothetical protein